MPTEICARLGIDFPILAFAHCRDVVREMVEDFATAVKRLSGLLEKWI